MPSQVVTTRRVKRRQQRQRFVSKNAKRKVRSVRKHRKTAKKVMSGGVMQAFKQPNGSSSAVTNAASYGKAYHKSQVESNFSLFEKSTAYYTAYVLYDKIPSKFTKTVGGRTDMMSINVPTCVVVIVDRGWNHKDDVYLFFNNRMTVEEITTTVKLLLGMSTQDTFELTPPISPPNPLPKNNELSALWNVTGNINIFVKLSGCILSTRYCLFSGTLDSPDTFDKVKTTEHIITTTNKKYNSLDGKTIRAYLEDGSENGFKNRVLTSNAVLPELYKKYIVAANPEYTGDVSEEAVELFGKDIEWTDAKVEENGKRRPIERLKRTYTAFKESSKKEIEEKILDKEIHKTYGFSAANIEWLTKNRPLEITNPMRIQYKVMNATSIFKDIDQESQFEVDGGFTRYDENWWVSKEAENLKQMVDEVQKNKRSRVVWD